MARATTTTTTRLMPSRVRTIFPTSSAAKPSTTRPSAASSARSGSGWTTGRSCAGRGGATSHRPDRWVAIRFVHELDRRMNKQLNDVIMRVQALPDERQVEAAALLLEFLDQGQHDPDLTSEQIAEIERRLSDEEPYATDDEVRSVYRRLSR